MISSLRMVLLGDVFNLMIQGCLCMSLMLILLKESLRRQLAMKCLSSSQIGLYYEKIRIPLYIY